MPRAAAMVPEYSRDDIREVFLYQYRIIYRILDDRVDVLAIVHGAKPLPEQWERLS
jgi:toxin ParE1/3/4